MHNLLVLAVQLSRVTDGSAPTVGTGPDMSWLMTVVAVLLATILGVAWAMRKLLAGAWRARATKRSLRVVDVLPLGGRRQLAVVRCYDRTFALGLGDKEVALVAELDPEFVEDKVAKPSDESGANPDAFTGLFDGARKKLAARRISRSQTLDKEGIVA